MIRKLPYIFKLLFLLFVLVAGAVWYAMPFYREYLALQEQEKFQNGEPYDVALLTRQSTLSQWWDTRKDLNDTFNTSYLSRKRVMSLELELPYTSLLAGEEPEDVFADVYLAARAPGILITHCRELLGTIASQCGVETSGGKRDADGVAQVNGALAFVPIDDPGTLANDPAAEIVTVRVQLNPNQTFAFTEQARREALDLTRSLCDDVRATHGNCVITRVNMSPRVRRNAPEPVLEASAQLAMFVNPATLDPKALRTELNAKVVAATR